MTKESANPIMPQPPLAIIAAVAGPPMRGCRISVMLPSTTGNSAIVPLTPVGWARLQEALIAASFWALDPNEGPLARGLDGAFWTI